MAEQGVQPAKSKLGEYGEKLAAGYRLQKGYQLVAFNWEKKWGELDLVAIDQNQLVFVEVKTRTKTDDLKPFEAVDQEKLKKIKRAASLFKDSFPNLPDSMRIDVISVELDTNLVEHFESVDFEMAM